MLVEWDDKYATGIDEIDGHHRKLVELLNKSYYLVLADSSQEELRLLLGELVDYAGYHFAAEEELMRVNNYSGIDGHLREHFSFNNRVLSYEKEARDGKKYLSVEVFAFIRNWLLDHILTADCEMSRAVRGR